MRRPLAALALPGSRLRSRVLLIQGVLLLQGVLPLQGVLRAQAVEDPDLFARLRPLDRAAGVFEDDAWHHWGASVVQGDDGRWHMFYARWPAHDGTPEQPDSFKDWLWTCEIARAVADAPTGPFRHVETVLRGRGPDHWDQLTIHNPRVRRFGERWFLYYIASRNAEGLACDRSSGGPNWMRVRNTQRTGVAIADALEGPWARRDAPILGPGGPIHDVAVNPTAVQRPDGTFLLVVKGDERAGSHRRRYGIAIGDAPDGPFTWHPDPIDPGFATEDPDVWFDRGRGRYYALVTQTVFNEGRSYAGDDGAIAMIRSDDGLTWTDADHPLVVARTMRMADGTTQRFWRVERPSVVRDRDGRVVALTCTAHPRDAGGNAKTIVLGVEPERAPGPGKDR